LRSGPGSLTIIGTGIRAQHLTPESLAEIRAADELLYLASEPHLAAWLETLHPRAEPLQRHYAVSRDRALTYEAMVEAMLAPARRGSRVAAAFYGHPGVFVTPSHAALAQARSEGIPARMLPAVSAEDCLFADLGLDPGRTGCQSYSASYFVRRRPPLDTGALVLLWQITVVGERRAVTEPRREGLRELTERLLEHYAPDHLVVVYEASPYAIAEGLAERIPLRELPTHDVGPLATLVVPPASS
jgi:uncharacterized protein YabN with tetrapyrrole methylase and pyrophosphatase domain